MAGDPLRPVLQTLAVVQGLIGLAQTFSPGWFYDTLANFGARSDHTLRDVATYYLASSAALLISVSRKSWRVPVLLLVLAQYVLHSLNHLFDIGKADPSWVGPADAVSLIAIAAGLGWALSIAFKQERP